METKEALVEMLTENTGRHMLDSGGAYGRHWERNQGKDFDKAPSHTVKFNIWTPNKREPYMEIDYTIDLYHFLLENLEYDDEVTKKFMEFANLPENIDEYWSENLDKWCKSIEAHGPDSEGIIGAYTYNEENLLNQDFMYWIIETDKLNEDEFDETYVILQIHGGCDARGGFTAPKIFQITDDPYDIMRYSYGYFGCGDCSNRYYTDDGYHWYNDEKSWNEPNWNAFVSREEADQLIKPIKKEIQVTPEGRKEASRIAQSYIEKELAKKEPNRIGIVKATILKNLLADEEYEFKDLLVIDDEKGHCPECGGNLEA